MFPILDTLMTHTFSPKINIRQDNVIIGTILGGSSIVKPAKGRNCYLSMRNKDIKWLKYKADQLSSLSSQKPFTTEKTNRWHSKCYPLFNAYRRFYGPRGRNLEVEHLDPLRDTGLAIWYGDCGKYVKEKVVLNTHIWGEEGSKAIVKYFSYLDYKAKVFKERDSFRVGLDEDTSAVFLKLVYPQLPYFFISRWSIPSHTPNQSQ